jgi:hypothetical protein
MPYGIELLRLNNMFGAPTSPSRGDLMGQMDNSYMTEPINFPIGNPYTPEPSVRNNPFQQTQEPIGNPFGDFNPAQVDFGPPKPIQPMSVRPQGDPTLDFQAVMDMINKTYTPATRAGNRFNELLDNVPERQEPNFMSRLAGAGAYLGNKSRGIPGGYEAQEKAMYAPYYREMMDWTAKTTPFSQASQQETTANSVERQLASSVATSAAQFARQQSTDAKNRADAEFKDRKLAQDAEIAAAKNQIARDKQILEQKKLSGRVQFTTNTPNMMMWDMDAKKWVDTGIPTKDMSTAEKMFWETQGRIAVNAARSQDPMSPGDTTKNEQNIMAREYTTTPEGERWIEIGDDGQYRMKQRPVVRPSNFLGMGEVPQSALDEWTNVYNKVYKGGVTTPNQNQVNPNVVQAPPQSGAGNQTPLPPGYRGPQLNTPGVPYIQPPPSAGILNIPSQGGVPNMPPAAPQGAQSTGGPGMQQLTPEQAQRQAADIASGKLIVWDHPTNPQLRIVTPNTYRDIEDSMTKGWQRVR